MLWGATYNLTILDESNFLSPKIFRELIPNLFLSGSKMICTSSQKNGQDDKMFVDLRKVRMDTVLLCVIEYVSKSLCCIVETRQFGLYYV